MAKLKEQVKAKEEKLRELMKDGHQVEAEKVRRLISVFDLRDGVGVCGSLSPPGL